MSEGHDRFQTSPSGDDTLRVCSDSLRDLRRLGRHIRAQNVFEAVVDGIETLTVQFDPAQFTLATVSSQVMEFAKTLGTATELQVNSLNLKVAFGGDVGIDLENVARHAGLSPDDLVKQICALDLEVDMLGFTPGFAYLKGVPLTLNVPRHNTPRQKVAAGSLGIAAGHLGTYALEGPGGWPIIGQVQDVLFDASLTNPFLLTAGDKVRLTAVSRS